MITFDVLTLQAFVGEEISFLTGARINKIQQPTRREFIFALRNNSETRQFYVNIDPQFYHLCFMSKENSAKRILEIPQKPPMFCMLLRKYLENSRIAKVCQPENERILEFYIETYNEVGEKIYLCLAFELMGKHSNVVLYNYDTNMIIGCAHNVGAEKSRDREIYGGVPYAYPPMQSNFDKKWVSLVEECGGKTLVNELIDDYYARYIAEHKLKALKQQYVSIVSQKLKKVRKSLAQIQYQFDKAEDFDKYRLRGDLIMANLYNLKDFSPVVTVFNYENNSDLQIELDPLKTLKENAGVFYKLYNKGKTSRLKLSEMIEELSCKKDYLEQVLYSIESSRDISDLYEISFEVIDNAKQPVKKNPAMNVEVIEIDEGTRIYIGKNNKQNDYIISKVASDEDLWFHVHNCAGSHVLLKTQRVTDDLVLRCAQLAKEYSSAKNSSKVGVIYTKRKYLRKPPGANLGYVTYKNEKELIID